MCINSIIDLLFLLIFSIFYTLHLSLLKLYVTLKILSEIEYIRASVQKHLAMTVNFFVPLVAAV